MSTRVEIRPFELRPFPVATLNPDDDYLPRVWAGSVYPMDQERRARRAAEQVAALQAGVRAVPSFRIGSLLLSGVADAARLKAAVDHVARPGATR